VQLASAYSLERDAPVAARDLLQRLCAELGGPPDLLVIHPSVTFEVRHLRDALRELLPQTRLHGSTSCRGAMTERGFHSSDGHGLAALGLRDPDGAFGVGSVALGADPVAAGRAAAVLALQDAGRPGEMPAAVLISSPPGTEEAVIRGIERVVGAGTPILGGSAADNNIAGDWLLFDRDEIGPDRVVVSALFPSTDVWFAFHSGYEPTSIRGKVTRAEGRTVYEIDGEPAAAVYARWVGGLDDVLSEGGNVLGRTTLHPLGRVVGALRGVPYFQLAHPNTVTPEGALTLFAEVGVGDELILMTGTPDGLVERAGRVARAALRTFDASPEDVAGGLVVYCAGCMLTVESRLDEVVDGLRAALPGRPLLGGFTFGEQGCFPGGENRHGNLMISVLLFARA
jgi:hypothetical protein